MVTLVNRRKTLIYQSNCILITVTIPLFISVNYLRCSVVSVALSLAIYQSLE